MKLEIFLPIILILISSCGWQLRGQQEPYTSSESIYISSNIPNNVYVGVLRRSLRTFGFETAWDIENADLKIVLTNFREDTRISSLNASARAAEYMLTEDIDFMITDNKGNELITLTTVSIERVYEFNEQDILASSNEERRIRNEMHKDIARKILNRIRSLPRSESLSEGSFGGS